MFHMLLYYNVYIMHNLHHRETSHARNLTGIVLLHHAKVQERLLALVLVSVLAHQPYAANVSSNMEEQQCTPDSDFHITVQAQHVSKQ